VVNRYIFAIDPGSEQSAFVLYDSHDKVILEKGIEENSDIIELIISFKYDVLAIEMIASYGMPVGASVFETCVWIGRFDPQNTATLIYRKVIKMHLCGSMRAKDSNIRQALIDKLGKEATKGVAKDMWSALAVAVTVAETHGG
jgi:hypothetical protein